MQTAAIYARVSTDWQAEHGYSLETQVSACEKYAADLGAVSVTKYIDDGYSGAYLDRPRLDALRDALQAKIYDVVIVYTPDRLARRLSHQLLITEEIEKSGATLHFVNGEYKTTPEGQLFFQMQGAFAEYEREKIRERTMRGRKAKLREGRPIMDSGVYGYDFLNGAYIINEKEADIVRIVYDLYETLGTVKQVADELTRRKIPSPAGKDYWHTIAVNRILRQPMYTGEYHSNKYGSTKTGAHSKHQFIKPEIEWIEMKCPAIITTEIFARAQRQLDMNKSVRKNARKESLFQGLMVCGLCGRKITTTYNSVNKFYACSGQRDFENPNATRCTARQAKTETVDSILWETIKKICKSPSNLRKYITSVKGNNAIEQTNLKAKMENRLEKIKSKKITIMDWFTNGYISKEDATKKLESLKAEELSINKQLPTIKENAITLKSDFEAICHAVNTCLDDTESKRKILVNIIDSIIFLRTDSNPKGKYELKFTINFK